MNEKICAWYAVSRFFLMSQKQTPFPLILPPSNPQKQQAIRLPTALSFSFYRFVYTLPSSHSLSLYLLSFRCSSSPYIRHISFLGLVHDRGGFNFYSIEKEINSSSGSLLNSLYILNFLSVLLALHHVLTSSIDYPCHCWRCSTSHWTPFGTCSRKCLLHPRSSLYYSVCLYMYIFPYMQLRQFLGFFSFFIWQFLPVVFCRCMILKCTVYKVKILIHDPKTWPNCIYVSILYSFVNNRIRDCVYTVRLGWIQPEYIYIYI
jgi:hypothetical protein